jgi:hypothetical protein
VTLFAYVVAGSNKESSNEFIYRNGLLRTADFTITGTTLNNDLKFNGIIYPPSGICNNVGHMVFGHLH